MLLSSLQHMSRDSTMFKYTICAAMENKVWATTLNNG